jgi:predicted GNAT family acetyltransferase
MIKLEIRPLTADRWDDFAQLFGKQGACYGCWCTHFRLPPKDRKANSKDDNRAFMKARVEKGPPPGLLGYADGKAVAWMQIGPRSDVPQWNTPRRVSAPLDDAPMHDPSAWAVSCFFTKSAMRGHGLSHPMVEAGIFHAREQGARILEACPIDCAKTAKSVGLFVGSTSVFRKAGFSEVALRKQGRPLLRLVL